MSINSSRLKIYIGFDAEEMIACNVARESIMRQTRGTDIHRVSRLSLGEAYLRPTSRASTGSLWDDISDAPMSTDHAIARFFVPWLCDYRGWALFVDGDVLCRADLSELLDSYCDERYALYCVQHPPLLAEGAKKDGSTQLAYPRKNWSSVMWLNCAHPANRMLAPLGVLNLWPGRDLHAFAWLSTDQIGELPAKYNYLVNVSAPMTDPAIAHFTLGTPLIPGHEHDPFADEWYASAQKAGYSVSQPERQLEQAG